jgi:hypothetical protein
LNLQQQLQSQTRTIESLRDRVHGQEKKVQDAQKSVFKLVKKARHVVTDDSQVRSILSNEFVRLPKDWAREYAINKEKARNNRSYESQPLRGELGKIARTDARKSEQFITKYPHIFVHGLLSQYVAELVFSQPFLPLNDEGSRQQSFSENLMDLYISFLKGELSLDSLKKIFTPHTYNLNIQSTSPKATNGVHRRCSSLHESELRLRWRQNPKTVTSPPSDLNNSRADTAIKLLEISSTVQLSHFWIHPQQVRAAMPI